MERRREVDASGKWLGIIVFLIGIGLLVFVFYRGYVEFSQIGLIQQGATPQKKDLGLNQFTLIVVARWVLLFLMAYVGSVIAGRGIGLYAASRGGFMEETA